nr:hypothetical protein [Gammaproteobacteria bacterium]
LYLASDESQYVTGSELTIGAEIMHFICNAVWKNNTMLSIAFLPFAAMIMPHNETLYDQKKSYSIIINASPETIWKSINNIDGIQPDEMADSWGAKIGIPTPISAFTINSNEPNTGLVRKCKWRKNVWFDEPITEYIPNKKLSWYFKFYPNSVPAGALDDHVTINGKHFKLNSASYDLEALGPQQTKLTFSLHYQVITDMNWYSGVWADFFMDDFAENVLILYKNRTEIKS